MNPWKNPLCDIVTEKGKRTLPLYCGSFEPRVLRTGLSRLAKAFFIWPSYKCLRVVKFTRPKFSCDVSLSDCCWRCWHYFIRKANKIIIMVIFYPISYLECFTLPQAWHISEKLCFPMTSYWKARTREKTLYLVGFKPRNSRVWRRARPYNSVDLHTINDFMLWRHN